MKASHEPSQNEYLPPLHNTILDFPRLLISKRIVHWHRLLRKSLLGLILVMVDIDVPRRDCMGCFDNAHGDCKWGYGEEADVQAEDDEKKIFWGPRNVEVTETEDIFDPYFFLLARGDGPYPRVCSTWDCKRGERGSIPFLRHALK
jgi:hypothetical protein